MIFRLLLAILIVGLLVLLARRIFRALNKPKKTKEIEQFADTVACHTCGVLLPKHEAIAKNGRYYCSPEHVPEHAEE